MNLETMQNSALVDYHNQLAAKVPGAKPTKRFSTRTAGIKRIEKLLNQPENKVDSPPTNKKVPKTPKDKAPARVMDFNLPAPNQDLRRMFENTLRAMVRDLLLGEGATFEQVMEAVGAYDLEKGKQPYDLRERAYEVIRLLNSYVGYEVRQDLDGVITIHG